MAQPDGGPAFPCECQEQIRFVADGVFDPDDPRNFTIGERRYPGMSLRDYFAAQAMGGFIASCVHPGPSLNGDVLAASAYQVADAMLKAREATAHVA